MSYERDKDRMTRGVGAIAAADHSQARARHRAAVARGTQRRDRAMADISRGALGRVDLREGAKREGGGTTAWRPPVVVSPPPPPPMPVKVAPVITETPPIVMFPPSVLDLPPAPLPGQLPTLKPKPPVVSGGGGNVGISTTIETTPPFQPLPMPDVPDYQPTTTGHGKTVLLVGAGIAALWWLFKGDS